MDIMPENRPQQARYDDTTLVGDIVIFLEGDRIGQLDRGMPVEPAAWKGTNGTREHPAIVTRVHADDRVNLHVLLDGTDSVPVIGVPRAREGQRATDRDLWRHR